MTAPPQDGDRPSSTQQPTLEEVAALAGVSRATVSRAINGSPRVSDRARSAVERAVERLQYVPNRAARSLVTRQAYSVALVVTEPDTRFFADPFFARVVSGATQALSDTGYQLVLMMPHSSGERGRLEGYLTGGHVDGAVLISLHGDDPLPARLHQLGVPTVSAGRVRRNIGVSFVDADNAGGARQAVAHLLNRGRRRIATITGPADMPAGVDRLAGYRDGLAGAGLPADPSLVADGDFTRDGGALAMRQLLDAHPDLDAVFAASDLMAMGALGELQAAGRRVPDDVAVVGFDDADIARSSNPPLTTIHQPIETLGQQAISVLLGEIAEPGPDPRQIVLDTELVLRASA